MKTLEEIRKIREDLFDESRKIAFYSVFECI